MTYCCFLCRKAGHCGRSSKPVLISVFFLFESGSEELNGLPAVKGVSSLMTKVAAEDLVVVVQAAEVVLEEVVNVTWLTSTLQIIYKHHKKQLNNLCS